jgi:hypothetical protein
MNPSPIKNQKIEEFVAKFDKVSEHLITKDSAYDFLRENLPRLVMELVEESLPPVAQEHSYTRNWIAGHEIFRSIFLTSLKGRLGL